MPRFDTHFDLVTIRSRLHDLPPPVRPGNDLRQAAVAMLLRGTPPFEVFFILRAKHAADPWSGDIGFPGGKIERNESPRQAAERETREEVGFRLEQAELLGYLSSIRGAHLPVEIHCAVYHLPRSQEAQCNHEVTLSFWVDLPTLLSAERFSSFPVRFRDERLVRPGIRILPEGEPVLWGITYRLLEQFFSALDIAFPPASSSPRSAPQRS